MPKIFNYTLGIINAFFNINMRLRQMQQQANLEKKNISQKFNHVQNSKWVFKDGSNEKC